jgi:hypothetical protein
MSIQGVNSQTRPVQQFQTQGAGFAQPAAERQQQQDPVALLNQALEALAQAVQALTSRGFNNNQSVASQAGQNLGVSGGSQGNPFDFSSLFSGGSLFEQPSVQSNPVYQPTFTPPAQAPQPQPQLTDVLDNKGGGGGRPGTELGLLSAKSGGGGRPGTETSGL